MMTKHRNPSMMSSCCLVVHRARPARHSVVHRQIHMLILAAFVVSASSASLLTGLRECLSPQQQRVALKSHTAQILKSRRPDEAQSERAVVHRTPPLPISFSSLYRARPSGAAPAQKASSSLAFAMRMRTLQTAARPPLRRRPTCTRAVCASTRAPRTHEPEWRASTHRPAERRR